jgi:PIN domain nuclease of toxin-antitoxin system
MILLDTHIWIWWLCGQERRLSAREIERLEHHAERGELAVSAISLWEVYMLERKKRVAFTIPLDQWLRHATDGGVTRVLPIDVSVISALATLPSSFHGDPADRLIAATSIAYGISLVSHDRELTAHLTS